MIVARFARVKNNSRIKMRRVINRQEIQCDQHKSYTIFRSQFSLLVLQDRKSFGTPTIKLMKISHHRTIACIVMYGGCMCSSLKNSFIGFLGETLLVNPLLGDGTRLTLLLKSSSSNDTCIRKARLKGCGLRKLIHISRPLEARTEKKQPSQVTVVTEARGTRDLDQLLVWSRQHATKQQQRQRRLHTPAAAEELQPFSTSSQVKVTGKRGSGLSSVRSIPVSYQSTRVSKAENTTTNLRGRRRPNRFDKSESSSWR